MKKIFAAILLMSIVFIVSCTNSAITTTDSDDVETTSVSLTSTNTTTDVSTLITRTTRLTSESTTVSTTTAPTTTVPTTTVPLTTEATTTIVTTTVTTEPEIDNDPPFVIQMQNESLKILQLTDLHLGNKSPTVAQQTLDLVTRLVNSDNYDIVVITGDQTYSYTQAPYYYTKLAETMEACETPWTFVFGNHDNAFNDYTELINAIPDDTEYLYFKVGPELEGGGYGNFVIQFQKNGVPFYELILMDSHAEREEFTAAEGRYDYLKESQVEWYESKVSKSVVDNLVFMHIPLRQYFDTEGYVGEFNEYICPQGVDTGLYDAFVTYGKTKGLFVGHDHKNDFYIVRDDIILGYGRVSGFGGYGDLEKGARVIEISSTKEINTFIILESDLD